MKHISKLSLLGIFAVSAICSLHYCDDSSDDAKLKYLELRGLNYDYVHFYKKSEDHKDKEQYQKSQENALQYKKKLNSYLIKSPGIKSLQDPNGYFSSDDKLGFNPLKEESINSLFKAKPYLVENGSHYFISKQKDEFSELDIQEPSEIGEVSGFTDSDFEVDFDESHFAFDEDGLPVLGDESSQEFVDKSDMGPNAKEISGLQNESLQQDQGGKQSQSIGRVGQQDEAQSQDSDPLNPKQIRFDRGVHKLQNGVKHLTKATKHLHVAMKKYKEYINSDNVHPDKVIHMRDRLQMHISRLHRINGVLQGYGHGLATAGKNNDLEGLKELHSIHKHQIATENMLDKETQNFENLMEETGNAYRFIPTDSINTAFIPKDQEPRIESSEQGFGVPSQVNNGQGAPAPSLQRPVEKPGDNPTIQPVFTGDNTSIKPLPINGEMSGQKPVNPDSNKPSLGTPVSTPGVTKPMTGQTPTKPTPIVASDLTAKPIVAEQINPQGPSTKPNPNLQNSNMVDKPDPNAGKKKCTWWFGKLFGAPKPDHCL